ncbi:hypothetical protein L226DRAFT_108199 [Lentinus tigrinus ALCF2SS1-7]|uniref:BTB domain-containing protein n=1 Tax=Lentinus tigrinus ALCF2SS1-6 TaxID=1328759 RepID=A0A5C2S5N3_9APHY|nr:hypothetical protein L227DRAFT_654372 [Lentinus tigrinus ALCF2SS1-6]RPD73335.1 hypothetical protein L226DRAFT_108199 [Lentinus tigrinus ALCF2SS1-7]
MNSPTSTTYHTMSWESDEETRMAPAPFNNPWADTIVRTMDNVDFHVFRWMLEDASPVFASMFTSPRPSKARNLRSPVVSTASPPDSGDSSGEGSAAASPAPISISETSRTLETLLRPYYPFPSPPTFTSFDDAQPVLLAAYKLQLTRIAPTLAQAALPHIKQNPLRAYAFALRYGMEDLARLAAHEFLAVENPDIPADSEELEDMTVRQYRRLVVYRRECAAALQDLIGPTNMSLKKESEYSGRVSEWLPKYSGRVSEWLPKDTVWTWFGCRSCVKGHSGACPRECTQHGTASWFRAHWGRIGDRLRARPSPDAIEDPRLLSQALSSVRCDACNEVAYTQLLRLMELLAEEIERRFAQVPLQVL